MQTRCIGLGVLAVGILVIALSILYVTKSAGECNVAYIPLRGSLETYVPMDASSSAAATASEDVTYAVRSTDADPSTRAIILAVDSPGGSPVAGEEIAHALAGAHKPTVALIREMGDSAAYLAATGAKKIFASAFSDVGDIGITSSYVDQSQYDAQQGLTYNQLSVGIYKDMFDPDKPMTVAEKALVMGQLQIDYQQFIDEVAANRHLDESTVKSLSDGRSFTGKEAFDSKLIDQIGGIEDVRTYLHQAFGFVPVICGVDR